MSRPAQLRTGISVRFTWALVVGTLLPGPAIAEVTIRLVMSEPPHVDVAGLAVPLLERSKEQPADGTAWQRVLALYVESETARPVSPVLGEYTVRRDRLIFTPRFPLKPGLRYRAVFDPASLPGKPSPARQRTEAVIFLPALPPGAPTVVDAVFPSSDELPENQLKFYIHFSAPMSRGDSYRHIRLLDAAGAPVEAPFLELAEELWDESGARLTLLLDPGRVKQDLKPHKEVGRALIEGRAYMLIIDDDWRDARGMPLASEFRKSFRVTEADVRQPDPHRWRLTLPDAGTRDPLVIEFDEPLDHAMVQRVVRVSHAENRFLDGRVSVARHETTWTFQPTTPWLAGDYKLLIDPTLEDLAGNSIERPFEVHLPTARTMKITDHIIDFEVRN